MASRHADSEMIRSPLRACLARTTALHSAVLLALTLGGVARADPAPNARPQGGVVSGGQATIARAASDTRITQGSARAVIDWTSFDVGSAQSVTFVQPGASATVLNRVNAAEPSQIAGRISANGQVVIENRSGVVFTGSAQVDAHALVASAAGISTAGFMAGSTNFDQPAREGAAVINQGRITVREAGLVALVAPNVSNSGVIVARAGRVILAGAARHTVDLYGDGLLSIDVGAADAGGSTVRNTGTIAAAGGQVLLSAAQADGMVTGLVEAGGRISADSLGNRPGAIRIQSTGGSVIVDGQVRAVGTRAGQVGGTIEIAASGTVSLTAAARVDASGQAGGGRVAVGQAAGLTAGVTEVQAGARVLANARQSGNGGSVTVMSATRTGMAGRISATGGARGGNGGAVEVSGSSALALTGVVDVGAVAGRAGSILIDPQDLVIQAGGGSGLFVPGGGGGTLAAGNNGGSGVAVVSTLDPAVLSGLTGTIVLQAARDLVVQSAFTSSAASLSLQAGRNLTVNAPVVLNGSGTLSLAAAVGGFTALPGYDAGGPLGILAIAPAGGVSVLGGQLVMSSGAGGVLASGPISARVLTVAISAGGAFIGGGTIQAGSADFTAGQIALPGTLTGGTIKLSTPGGAIDIGGTVSATGGITLAASTGLAVGGTVSAGGANTLDVTVGGAIALGSASQIGTLAGGHVNLNAGGPISGTTGVVAAGTLTVTGVGDVTLNGANRIGVLAGLGVAGNVSLSDSQALTVSLPMTVTGAGHSLVVRSSDAIGVAAGATISADGLVALIAQPALGGSGAGLLTIAGRVTSGSDSVFLAAGRDGVYVGAPITAASGKLISVVGDIYVNANPAFNTLNAGVGGTIALAPFTSGTAMALGWGSGLALADTTGMTAGTLIAGAVVVPGFGISAITAGGIDVNGFSGTGVGRLLLQTTGAVTQSGAMAGVARLDGTAASVALGGANAIGALGNITTSGDMRIANGQALVVLGTLQAGGAAAPSAANTATLHLDVAGALVLGQAGSHAVLNAGTVVLVASGTISEPNGSIAANLLTGPRAGEVFVRAAAAVLNGVNTVTALGGFSTSGNLAFTNSTDLGVAGGLSAGLLPAPNVGNTSTIELIAGGGLTLGPSGSYGAINAGRVSLLAPGTISEPNGVIFANVLVGPAPGLAVPAAAAVSLTGSNQVAAIGSFTTLGNLRIADQINVALIGTLSAGPAAGTLAANTAQLEIDTLGDIRVGQAGAAALLNAGTLALVGAGTIAEANGSMIAGLLLGPGPSAWSGQAAAVQLGGANLIGRLGRFVSAGSLMISDSTGLVVVGTVTAGSQVVAPAANPAALSLLVAGGLGIGATGSPALLAGGTVSLVASGTISEQANGVIAAHVLNGPGPAQTFAAASGVALGGGNSIDILGTVITSGGFLLRNTADLLVAGTVSAGGVAAPGASNTATLGLVVAGNLTLGSAGTATLLNAGTVGLAASGAVVEVNGGIAANLLNDRRVAGAPASATEVLLTGNNTLAALGELAAWGDVVIHNSTALQIAGTVSAGGSLAPDAGNTGLLQLTLPGALAIGQAGTVGALNGGVVSLLTPAAVSEPNGMISTNLLTLPASGQPVSGLASVSLPGANAIASLGAINAAGDVLVANAMALGSVGAIMAGTPAAPASGNGATITLAANGDLAIGAALNAGRVVLLAAGTISQTGVITTGTLSGPAAGQLYGAAAAAVLTAGNTIATLGAFTTTGALSLTDATGLEVAGAVSAGASGLSLAVGGALTIGGASHAGSLAAGSIVLSAGGTISERATGSIVTALLTGPDPAAHALTATALTLLGHNSIGALGSMAVNGDILLANNIGLTVAGTLVAGAASASLSANVARIAIAVSSGGLAIGGGSGTAVLSAGTLALAAVAGIQEGNGRVVANLLTDQTGIAGTPVSASVSLPAAGNAIGTLGTISTASGRLLVQDTGPLGVAGPVSGAGGVQIATTGALTLLGSVSGGGVGVMVSGDTGVQQISGAVTAVGGTASALGILAAQGGFVQFVGGTLASSGSVAITTAGTISLGGAGGISAAAGNVNLTSTANGIAEVGSKGGIAAATLNAVAAGAIVLESDANRIDGLGAVSAGGRLSVVDGVALGVSGRVAVSDNGTITLKAPVITIGGSIVALGAGGEVNLTASGGSIAEVAAGGGVGRIDATMLTAVAAQSIALAPAGAANHVATLAASTAVAGDLSLANASDLAVSGTIAAAGGVGLGSGQSVLVPAGSVVMGTDVSATAVQAVTVAGTIRAGNAVVLGGGQDLVITTGAMVKGYDLSGTAAQEVAVGGAITADKIYLGGNAGSAAALVAFSPGAMLNGGASGSYGSNVPVAGWPGLAAATGGTFISTQNLSIAGSLTLLATAPGISPTLRIDLAGTGVLDPSGGLVAPNATVFIDMGSHANLSGAFEVGALALAYPRGGSGSAELSGTVRGIGGQAAAQIVAISPGPNAAYRLNACAIASVSCFVVSTERLPQSVPIRDLDIRPARDTVDETEVLLPNVSSKDF